MGAPVPPSVVEAFGAGGTPGTDYTLIPVPSQTGVSPELASFTTGFPPATRLAKTSGGIPPRGLDMNGILFMLSAHTAWVASGNAYAFDAQVVSVAGGYNVGAIIRSAVDPTQFFMSLTANNTADPDVTPTNWLQFSPFATPTATQAGNIAAGSQTVAVTGNSGFLDLTPNAGATTLTNLTGGNVGQVITVTNLHASNSLTLQANANLRLAGDVTLLQNGSLSLRRRTSTQWVSMS